MKFIKNYWKLRTWVQLIIQQFVILQLVLFLEFTTTSWTSQEGDMTQSRQIQVLLRHYTELEALKVFIGQSADPSEQSKDNLGTKHRRQVFGKFGSHYGIWFVSLTTGIWFISHSHKITLLDFYVFKNLIYLVANNISQYKRKLSIHIPSKN